jgi:hypothetical protein
MLITVQPFVLRKAHDKQQEERSDRDDNQREVPVEPEHQSQHEDNRHQVDESGIPQKAEVGGTLGYFRVGPITDITVTARHS